MTQKSLSLVLLFTFVWVLSHAQPILQNNVVPNIGDAFKITQVNPATVSEGSAGANQTWNFSGMQPANGTQPVQHRYIAPAGTPYFSNFPAATIVVKVEEDTVTYGYFKEDAAKLSLLGSGSLAYDQRYTDPDVQLQYPTSYNGSFQDNFSYTTDAGTGIIFTSTGSRTIKYDGYGTLTTPLGTFPNTMRIKSVSTQVDSAEFFGSQIINHTDITTYDWLNAGRPGALVSVYYIQTTSETRIPGFDTIFTPGPLTKAANYISETSVGVFDLPQNISGLTSLTVGPNPASDVLTLRFEANMAGQPLQISISDVAGRVIETRTHDTEAGENTVPLSVSQLTPGAYYVTLSDGRHVKSLAWQKTSR